MANIAQGEAECYISIKAECQVLYFTYSTWQGNDLSVIKNSLTITCAVIKHTKFADFDDKLHRIRTTLVFSNTLLSYPVLKGLRKTF